MFLLLIVLVSLVRHVAIVVSSCWLMTTLKRRVACLPVIPTPMRASIVVFEGWNRHSSTLLNSDLLTTPLIDFLKASICLAGVARALAIWVGSAMGLS